MGTRVPLSQQKPPPKTGNKGKDGREKGFPGSRNGVLVTMDVYEPYDHKTGELTGPDEPIGQITRMAPPDEWRCQAICRKGKYRHQRCMNSTIHGGTVCNAHGGKLPNVKKAAQARLAQAALPAAAELIRIALKKRGVSDADKIRALTEILNRAGVSGKTTIEIEVAPWQAMLSRIAGELPGGAEVEEQEGIDYDLPGEFYENTDGDDEDGE